jgi:hypothetical protein
MNTKYHYLYFIHDNDFNILGATIHHDSAFAMTLLSVKIRFYYIYYKTHEELLINLNKLNILDDTVYRARPNKRILHDQVSDISDLETFLNYRKSLRIYLELHDSLCDTIEMKTSICGVDSKLRIDFYEEISRAISESNPEQDQYSSGICIYSNMNHMSYLQSYNELKTYQDSVYITRMSLLSSYRYLRDLINSSSAEQLTQTKQEIERVLWQV